MTNRIAVLAGVACFVGVVSLGCKRKGATPSTGPGVVQANVGTWGQTLVSGGDFVIAGSSRIVTLPLGGGTPSTILSQQGIVDVAVDRANAYAAVSVDSFHVDVVSVPLAGGAATTLATNIKYSYDPHLMSDGTNLFIYGSESTDPGTTNLWSIPVAGGGKTGIANPLTIYAGAVDGTSVYWAEVLEYPSMAIYKAAADGSGAVRLATTGTVINSMVFQDGRLYYSASEGIASIAAAGGAPNTILQGETGAPEFLTTNGTDIYWLLKGLIRRVPLKGKSADVKGVYNIDASSFAVVDQTVYWTNSENGGTLHKYVP